MSWTLVQTIGFILGLFGIGLTTAGIIGRRLGPGLRCRGCGYDVADIVAEQSACPECGRSLEGRAGTVSGARVRRPGLLLLGLALLVPASASGWYVSTVAQPLSSRPTPMLAAAVWLGPPSENAASARELLNRWRSIGIDRFSRRALIHWGVSPWAEGHPARGWQHAEIARYALAVGGLDQADIDRFFDRVLQDAGDDSNTQRQRTALRIASELGTLMGPRLERALDEPEYRDAAVTLLLDELDNEPSARLVEAAIDALGQHPGDASTGPATDRLPIPLAAQRAARYLTHHIDRTAPELRQVIATEAADRQQSLLAALVLTEAQDPADAKAIARAVTPSLEPNDVAGDALLASRALLRSGAEAVRLAHAEASDPAAIARLDELGFALDGPGEAMPPHLERLAGPLPWQIPDSPAPRRRLLP